MRLASTRSFAPFTFFDFFFFFVLFYLRLLFCFFSRHKGFLASLSTQDDDDEDRRRSSNIDLAASATGLGWDEDSQEDKNGKTLQTH